MTLEGTSATLPLLWFMLRLFAAGQRPGQSRHRTCIFLYRTNFVRWRAQSQEGISESQAIRP